MAEVVVSEVAAQADDSIELTSPAFEEGEILTQRYTDDGTEANPPLQWANVPDGTAELALVVEDPDAGDPPFVHWLVAGLEPTEPGSIPEDEWPEGVKVGVNDYGDTKYSGPNPPADEAAHRYVFTLIASGAPLGLGNHFTARELRDALQGNVLAKGVLVARYGRAEQVGVQSPPSPGG